MKHPIEMLLAHRGGSVWGVALDLRQLECFVAVAEELNFGRAASRLHMTQPPLTRRIHRLERDVGAALFVRTAHGAELTVPGETLLEQARRILQLGERAVELTRASQAGTTGRLVVGYFGSSIFDAVPRILADFAARHDGVDVLLERIPKSAQVDALREGRIHIGLSRLYPAEPGMTVRDLLLEPLFVALSGGHRFRARRRLALADLDGAELLLFPRARPGFADVVLRLLDDKGIQPRVHSEAEDVVTAVAQVAVSHAVAVLPESATAIAIPGVSFIPLADAPAQPLSCIYRDDHQPPVLRRFLAFLDQWSMPES
jgi:DNA-binding transcriptional LysR family regulator